MLVDPAEIERALAPLIGLPLCSAHRALDIQMFEFGAERERVQQFGRHKGEVVTVREYSLHTQCSWRIRGATGIVVGWVDWYDEDVGRGDQRIAAWLAAGPYEVLRVRADAVGGCSLELAGGYALDVFPHASHDGEYSEHWRLLAENGHFVVSGSGLERA